MKIFLSMCAQFTIRVSPEELVERLKTEFQLSVDLPDCGWASRILPHQLAPVLLVREKRLSLEPMNFSLIPSWSKTPRVKFATHNARVESLAEKPTWRTVLKTRHCAIPITGFIEPIYIQKYAGHMVSFERVDRHLFLAAGLWDSWVNKETGEIKDSFTIITSEPPEFVAQVGHDRCPIFLSENRVMDWLQIKDVQSTDWIQFLKSDPWTGSLEVSIDRPLKPGWEKRV